MRVEIIARKLPTRSHVRDGRLQIAKYDVGHDLLTANHPFEYSRLRRFVEQVSS